MIGPVRTAAVAGLLAVCAVASWGFVVMLLGAEKLLEKLEENAP